MLSYITHWRSPLSESNPSRNYLKLWLPRSPMLLSPKETVDDTVLLKHTQYIRHAIFYPHICGRIDSSCFLLLLLLLLLKTGCDENGFINEALSNDVLCSTFSMAHKAQTMNSTKHTRISFWLIMEEIRCSYTYIVPFPYILVLKIYYTSIRFRSSLCGV